MQTAKAYNTNTLSKYESQWTHGQDLSLQWSEKIKGGVDVLILIIVEQKF